MDPVGLITIRSSYGPEETMKRLEAEVRARGMSVFGMSIIRPAPQRLAWRCGRRIYLSLAPRRAARP
jgi:hypothetical protein